MDKWIEYAPLIIVVIAYIYQNNVFVRPEQLERMHRTIIDEITNRFEAKYVEINAYKEFQNHVLSKLEEVSSGIDKILFSMKGNSGSAKDDD